MSKIKTTQHHFVDAPSEESTVLFLLKNGWSKLANMPKYQKDNHVVNVKFMQDLINIVANVEGIDSHEVVILINEVGCNV